jgi:hypothetical protein
MKGPAIIIDIFLIFLMMPVILRERRTIADITGPLIIIFVILVNIIALL